MKLFSTTFFLFVISFSIAQQPTFSWAKNIGGSFTDVGLDVASDDIGNVYLCGRFQNVIDADPGSGVFQVTSAGNFDMIVVKFDPDGNFLWAKTLGASGYDELNDIEIDHEGNCILAGSFEGTINPDPNANETTISAGASGETIILKLDANGNTLWYQRTLGDEYAYSEGLAIDSNNDIYVAGSFGGTCDFNPDVEVGQGAANSVLATSFGLNDIFVYKLLSDGSFDWVKTTGSTDFDAAKTLCVDVSDRVLVGGRFRGTCDFDPNDGVQNATSAGLNDCFVLELTSAGDYAWHTTFGSDGFDELWSLDTDSEGNLVTFGYFSGAVDLDPGAGSQIVTSNGSDDLFIQKWNNNGELLWVKTIGGSEFENSYGITCDSQDNIIAVGDFFNTVDFDPGANVANLTSAGNNDIYYLKLDSDGEYVWAIRIGATFSQAGYALTTDMDDNILSTGTFSNTVDFNPGAENAPLAAQEFNMYILKLGGECQLPQLNAVNTNVTSTCEGELVSVTLDGNLQGAETWILKSGACNGASVSSTTDSNFDFTPVANENYYVVSDGGCPLDDQQLCVPISININPNYQIQESFNSCSGESFTFPDGLSFNLVSNVDYVSNLTSAAGCDSVVNTSVFIFQLPTDIDIELNNGLIEVINFPSKSTIDVQWVDCNNNFEPIDGETNLTFTPSGQGSWAMVYSDDVCTAQTDCITIVGIEESESASATVFPNPFENEIVIQLQHENLVDVNIYSLDGTLVMSKSNHPVSTTLVISDEFASGIYVMKIVGQNSQNMIKAVKK